MCRWHHCTRNWSPVVLRAMVLVDFGGHCKTLSGTNSNDQASYGENKCLTHISVPGQKLVLMTIRAQGFEYACLVVSSQSCGPMSLIPIEFSGKVTSQCELLIRILKSPIKSSKNGLIQYKFYMQGTRNGDYQHLGKLCRKSRSRSVTSTLLFEENHNIRDYKTFKFEELIVSIRKFSRTRLSRFVNSFVQCKPRSRAVKLKAVPQVEQQLRSVHPIRY